MFDIKKIKDGALAISDAADKAGSDRVTAETSKAAAVAAQQIADADASTAASSDAALAQLEADFVTMVDGMAAAA